MAYSYFPGSISYYCGIPRRLGLLTHFPPCPQAGVPHKQAFHFTCLGHA